MREAVSILIEDAVSAEAHRLRPGVITDYDPLIAAVGDARFVLLGEASSSIRVIEKKQI